MKRFFFWFVVALVLFILFFIGLNLFDSRAVTGSGALARAAAPHEAPLAANLEPGNGFFVLWGFAAEPQTDLAAPAFRERLIAMLARSPRLLSARSPYGQWLARLNVDYRQNWQGTNFYFPQSPHEDLAACFSARRPQIAGQQQRFAPLLRRYQLVLASAELADFTPLNRECPSRSLMLATQTAKYYAASRVLAALDGDWPAAGADLLAAADAGFKLIAFGRTLAVNALGKSMVELSLRALASLLNRPECPPEFARLVLDRLPDLPIQAFGTGSVRAFNWLSFASSLARVKKERIVDPALLKDYFRDPTAFYALVGFVGMPRMRLFSATHALAAFFIKENESLIMMRNFWDEVGALESVPPWRWSPGPGRQRRSMPATSGPFWWLRNPLGKMMVQSAVPYYWPILQKYAYRSRELQVRYDLTRLLARARQAAAGGEGLAAAALERLLAAADRDPFSGRPYRFGRGPDVLYSVGADAVDNRGRERQALWQDSDIAVPIAFVSQELERR